MRIIEPSYEILTPRVVLQHCVKLIEVAGRTCYKTDDKITIGTAEPFILMIRGKHHDSVIEHSILSVKVIVDRGVSHELIRHRLCAFSQESTRYCNYNKGKFGGEITVIRPDFFEPGTAEYGDWYQCCLQCEKYYLLLINNRKRSPQEARSVLPNSLKTEVVITANFREWRHIFSMRTPLTAHPQMRQIMVPLHQKMCIELPCVFQD